MVADCPSPISLRDALAELPEVVVDDAAEKLLRNGDSRALTGRLPTSEMFKVIHKGELVAVAKATSRVTAVIVRGFQVRHQG